MAAQSIKLAPRPPSVGQVKGTYETLQEIQNEVTDEAAQCGKDSDGK